jgi:lipoprotein-releasing system ATP-binding protein
MLLEVRDVSKSYKSRYGRTIRDVLKNTGLSVSYGEKIAIAGPSGSGKTTLLNLAGTLDSPDSGEIYFRGVPLSGMDTLQLAAFRNKEIGFIFQFHHLLPQLTLWENILIPALPGNNGNEVYGRAEELLKETGLWEIRHQKPGELSGGECQRSAVIRALINGPSLILADEPTGSLDSENASMLASLLIKLSEKENFSMIVVTHSNEIAGRMDKTYYLKDGKLELNPIKTHFTGSANRVE